MYSVGFLKRLPKWSHSEKMTGFLSAAAAAIEGRRLISCSVTGVTLGSHTLSEGV